ncbi:FMN-dependent NADH-azoreductase [Alkalicoccus chagannorensis]|uniref:FMN-dependent NADH-azoreductase n=1 Tax=Alkalicoccus chagannorensis TaxID=427072 RepID=UPI000419AECE|nr:NAD(P)H-dependent oxidoreductase [Alkalicoccus chagannorensis]
MRILLASANPKEEQRSCGLRLAQFFQEEVARELPETVLTIRDLYEEPSPFLGGDVLDAWERETDKPVTTEEVEQLLEQDVLVLVTPLWNMGIPAAAKAYIDRLILPEKTFTFGDKGIEGLMQKLTVVHLQSRGGIYSEGKLAAFEHGESYMRTIWSLTGVQDYHHIVVEGTSTYPDEVDTRLAAAEKEIRALVASWKAENG